MRTLNILGKKFKYKKVKEWGASFDFAPPQVQVGGEYPDNITSLMHEICEIILVDMNCRYSTYDDTNGLTFIMSHPQFDTFACTLTQALMDHNFLNMAELRRWLK